MDILNMIDHDDGSCTLECSFSDKEIEFFLNYAIKDILKKQMESENKKECFDCGEGINSETIKDFPDTEICSECMNDE